MHIGIPVVMVSVTGATDDIYDGRYDVMLGDSFTIACMLDCPTNASVTWSQNENVIISSSETMMMPEGFLTEYQNNGDGEIVGSTLTRNMAALNNSATYQCGTTIQNIQSNAMADIFVYSKCSCTCKKCPPSSNNVSFLLSFFSK